MNPYAVVPVVETPEAAAYRARLRTDVKKCVACKHRLARDNDGPCCSNCAGKGLGKAVPTWYRGSERSGGGRSPGPLPGNVRVPGLASIRRARRVTWRRLAEESGVPLSTLKDYGVGRNACSPEVLAKLAEVLGCGQGDLTSGEFPTGEESPYYVEARGLRAALEERSMSIIALAREMERDPKTVGNWTRLATKAPRDGIEEAARILGVDPERLTGEEE